MQRRSDGLLLNPDTQGLRLTGTLPSGITQLGRHTESHTLARLYLGPEVPCVTLAQSLLVRTNHMTLHPCGAVWEAG